MGRKWRRKILTLALISSLIFLMQRTNMLTAGTSNEIRISGLVNKPLSFTYADLLSFPMVSEVATLYCPFDQWKVTFNWTGVPLFHLLTLAQVKPEAVGIDFRARDNYFLNMKMEEVLKPTTILALKANGTLLSEITGREGGFRIVFPCKYGYNWVAKVKEIKAVDHNPTADEADMPNCVLPSITPPLQVINVSFGKRKFQVEAFTNASIKGSNFNYIQKEIGFNITVPSGATGFADFIIPQSLLKGPYSVFLDETAIEFAEVNVANHTFIYLTFPEGSHSTRIGGTQFWGIIPEAVVEFDQITYVDETIDFDASKSVDDGEIVSYKWDFGNGIYGNGTVVSHSYSKEGTYQVILDVTDNDGLSNRKLLTVIVEKYPEFITVIRLASAVIICTLALILIILLLARARATSTDYGNPLSNKQLKLSPLREQKCPPKKR